MWNEQKGHRNEDTTVLLFDPLDTVFEVQAPNVFPLI